MSLKHAKTSAKTDGADATLVQPSDWNADHVVDSGGVTMASTSTTPTSPSSGNMVVFGKSVGGSPLPAFIGPAGLDSPLQPFLGTKKVALWSPAGNSAVINNLFGMQTPATLGTATSRSVATTRLFTSLRRVGCVSAATAGSRALIYNNDALQWWRGNGTGLGGFRAVFRFGCSDAATVSGARSFVGMAATSAVGNGSDPSASLNLIGIGSDAADTNLQIMYNDGAGTATKVSLGANFPDHTLSVDVYELVLCAAPNASTVTYQVTRLNTGDTASGTISTDLPASTQLLQPIFVRANNATALAVGIDVMMLYIESDY